MNCTLTNMGIRIEFPYSIEMDHKIQSLTGRIFSDTWYASVQVNNLNLLKEWGFKLDQSLQKVIDDALQKEKEIIRTANDKLYPFQKEAVAFTELQNGRFLKCFRNGVWKIDRDSGMVRYAQRPDTCHNSLSCSP